MTDEELYRKVSKRLVPILFVGYVIAYLDRINVSFAKLAMAKGLGFGDRVYGIGAGIFFIGYFAAEIPSNVVMHAVGARRWLARIMITWGLLSAATLWVREPWHFYGLRFVLGLAEAGFFPGVILYLTYWYPASFRGRWTATFMTAIPLSGVVGAPMSGLLMQSLDGAWGWAGWQWMFLVEAIPACVLGLVILRRLEDGIDEATWLSRQEKERLHAAIAAENTTRAALPLGQALRTPLLWGFALLYFCVITGLYGIGFWLPTIIAAMGVKDTLHVGLLTAIPYAVAALAMVLVSHSADRRDERRWHLVLPMIVGAAGVGVSTQLAGQPVLAIAALTFGTAGVITALPNFWALPTRAFQGRAAAGGIALVNAFGNLAGFVAPYVVGWLKDTTHSTAAGMLLVTGVLALGAALASFLARPRPVRA